LSRLIVELASMLPSAGCKHGARFDTSSTWAFCSLSFETPILTAKEVDR
jgi:hypothetical protein